MEFHNLQATEKMIRAGNQLGKTQSAAAQMTMDSLGFTRTGTRGGGSGAAEDRAALRFHRLVRLHDVGQDPRRRAGQAARRYPAAGRARHRADPAGQHRRPADHGARHFRFRRHDLADARGRRHGDPARQDLRNGPRGVAGRAGRRGLGRRGSGRFRDLRRVPGAADHDRRHHHLVDVADAGRDAGAPALQGEEARHRPRC
jgi:hypothetical protein